MLIVLPNIWLSFSVGISLVLITEGFSVFFFPKKRDIQVKF